MTDISNADGAAEFTGPDQGQVTQDAAAAAPEVEAQPTHYGELESNYLTTHNEDTFRARMEPEVIGRLEQTWGRDGFAENLSHAHAEAMSILGALPRGQADALVNSIAEAGITADLFMTLAQRGKGRAAMSKPAGNSTAKADHGQGNGQGGQPMSRQEAQQRVETLRAEARRAARNFNPTEAQRLQSEAQALDEALNGNGPTTGKAGKWV